MPSVTAEPVASRSALLHKASSKLVDAVKLNIEAATMLLEAIHKMKSNILGLSADVLIRALSASTILLIEIDSSEAGNNDPLILYVSDALEQSIFGYFPGELSGKPLSTLVPTSRRPVHLQHMAKFRQSPTNRPMADGQGHVEGLCKDGTILSIDVLINVFGCEGKMYAVANVTPNRILNETGLTNSGILRLKKAATEGLDQQQDPESIHS